MPNPGAGEANVIPILTWDSDITTIVEKGEVGVTATIIPGIKIKSFICTPGFCTVDDQQFPVGVVILNENSRPVNSDSISTKGNPNFELMELYSPATVYIGDDAGWPGCPWPTGKIILWK